jgi:arylsulfatase A-like enzyme
MALLTMRRIVEFNLRGDGAPPGPALRLLATLHRYAATYLDGMVRGLRELAAADGRGAVMCVTSDHGEEFGEHGALAHMFTLDEPALHIPMVVHGDGVPVGERADTVDLRRAYATMLGAAGVEATAGSPASLFDPSPADAVAERERIELPSWAPADGPRVRERTGRMRSVYRDPWKLVSTDLAITLYDVSADPAESRDVAGEHPEVVHSLEASLPVWPDYFEEQPEAGDGSGLSAKEEEEIQEQLSALGYLE